MKPPFDLIDTPPVWLAGFLGLAFALSRLWTAPLPALHWLGAALAALGLGLAVAAVLTMAAARTTVIPRRDPSALVTHGVFRLSRNPIYLGDALVLTGAALWWGAPAALLLVPAFLTLITRRYILAEEARLRAAFGPAFEAWAARTRRWL